MANVQDINITSTYDIDFYNGDFKVVDSDENHILLIVKSNVGGFKEYPLVGFGIDYYIASTSTKDVFKRDLTVQLTNDDYTVNAITVLPNTFEYYIDAIRNTN